IARVTGPTIDVEFAPDEIPAIYNALVATVDNSTIGQREGTLEMTFAVNQHLGNNLVRAVARRPTDGSVRRMEGRGTGGPITVPVGDGTLGNAFSVSGEPRSLAESERLEIKERWAIHRKPPTFDELEAKTTMCETGIKVID